MCELLGLSFNKPVDIQISFTGFRERGRIHRDGWGLGSYDADGKAHIVKEAAEAAWSERSKALASDLSNRSEIYIGHVRMMSRGERLMENTHPFQRDLNGKDHLFAHNGTLTGYHSYLPLKSFFPQGETDSEWAFCYLMDQLNRENLNFSKAESYEQLLDIFRHINATGKFNCLFSDGERLFAYVDQKGYNGLCFTHRQPPFHRARLLDSDWEVDLGYIKDPGEHGYVIATQKLTDEEWEKMRPGELIVFEKGKMIWSSARDLNHQ